jgi:hypothetical protein
MGIASPVIRYLFRQGMGSSHLVSSYCECGGGSGIVEPKFFPSNLHLLKKETFRRHKLATVLTVLLSSFIKKNLSQ